MALFETVLVSDLKKPVQVKELTGNLFSADNNGNKITVSVMDNGTTAQISGNVTGYVIRADGKTVIVEGELVGNMASIVLPASAYAVIGRVSIVVKVGTTTVGACTSNVYRSTTDEIVDPGHVVPDITELLEKIAECEEATAAAEAAAIAAGYVDIDMSKTGKTITVSITNKNNQTKTQTIVEPTVTVTNENGIITITATDADGTTTVSYEALAIDDTAGEGDTDKAWSADKTYKLANEVRQTEDNLYAYRETSGNPVEVYDAVASAVKTMRIEIAPVQDLNGYDHPWAGGAGKNKCKPSFTEPGQKRTESGINVTYYADGSITVDGTYTASSAKEVEYGVFTLPAGTYVLSGQNGVDSSNKLALAVFNGTTALAILDYTTSTYTGDEYEFTLSEAVEVRAVVYLRQGLTLSSAVKMNPMVRLSSVTDKTYEPYSNICPISGWTECNVTDTGRNLFDGTLIQGYYVDGATDFSIDSASLSNDKFKSIKVYLNPGTYTISFGVSCNIARFIADNVADKNIATNVTSYTFTTTTAGYVGFSFRNYANTTWDVNTTIQLEKGKSASPYEPFGTVSTIPFGQTVYGAELTINRDGTGQVVPDKIVADLSTLTWSTRYTGQIKKCVSTNLPENYFSGDSNLYLIAENYAFKGYANSASIFSDPDTVEYGVYAYRTTSSTRSTAFYCILDIDQNPTGNVVYKTAETLSPISLTAQQVQLLTGYNTVYADTGAILSMIYPVEKYQTVEQADKERIHIADSTDEPVKTLTDGADGVPMAMQIAVEPVQDLHGQTSPWPAGGGKNQLPDTVAWESGSYGSAGNKIVDDTKVRTNGATRVKPNTTYTISFGDDHVFANVCLYTDSAFISRLFTNTFTTTAETTRISITAGADTSTTVKCQLEEGSSASPWQPYSNICPISGWTEAKIGNSGNNLITPKSETETFDLTGNGTYRYGQSFEGGKTYTIVNRTSNQFAYRVPKGDLSNRGTTLYVAVNSYATVAVDSDSLLWLFDTSVSDWVSNRENLNVNTVGDTTFHSNHSYTIQFGETVYGGTLTVNKDGTGTLIADRGYTVWDGTETIGKGSGSKNYFKNVSDGSVAGKTSTGWLTQTELENIHLMCNLTKTEAVFDDTYIHASAYCGSGLSLQPRIFLPDCETVEQATAWLQAQNAAGHPLTWCYLLKEPVTIPLSAPIVRSLLGVNNLYADTGNILSVDYSADTKLYVDKLFASLTNATGVSF